LKAAIGKVTLTKLRLQQAERKLSSLERKGVLKHRREPEVQTVSDNKPPAILNKEGRKLIVVDVRKSMTAEMADYFIQVEPNKDYEIMQAIRALVKDQELDVEEVAGIPVAVSARVS
jgi:hypothetical protein